jgi:antitoxin component YwqK of YwqJK toxin-antitoxin module
MDLSYVKLQYALKSISCKKDASDVLMSFNNLVEGKNIYFSSTSDKERLLKTLFKGADIDLPKCVFEEVKEKEMKEKEVKEKEMKEKEVKEKEMKEKEVKEKEVKEKEVKEKEVKEKEVKEREVKEREVKEKEEKKKGQQNSGGWYEYDKNRNLISEKEKEKITVETSYNSSGHETVVTKINGIKRREEYFTKNNVKIKEYNYNESGQQDGEQLSWRENGTKEYKEFYVNNKKEGVQLYWDRNDNLCNKYHYKNGK